MTYNKHGNIRAILAVIPDLKCHPDQKIQAINARRRPDESQSHRR